MNGQLYEEKVQGVSAGGYRLCQIKMVEVPYYIENVSMNIYSIEELCYYLYHNIFLLDETIINEGLLEWIRDQLGLKKLYHALFKELEEYHGIGDFVLLIFKEINYLTHQEFKEFHNKLMRLEHEPAIGREKLKADYLVENKKYVNAIKVYKSILNRAKGSRLGGQFIGEVHHNMGCAYMHMFQYEEALACFGQAYGCLPEARILKAYLTACYITKPYAQYIALAEELKVTDEIRTAVEDSVQKLRDTVPVQASMEDVDGFLTKIRKEYHNSADH